MTDSQPLQPMEFSKSATKGKVILICTSCDKRTHILYSLQGLCMECNQDEEESFGRRPLHLV